MVLDERNPAKKKKKQFFQVYPIPLFPGCFQLVFYIPRGAWHIFFLSMLGPIHLSLTIATWLTEIATAEAAMADEEGEAEETPREVVEVVSSCFWMDQKISAVLRTVSIFLFFVGAMTKGYCKFFLGVKLQNHLKTLSDWSLKYHNCLLNLLESKPAWSKNLIKLGIFQHPIVQDATESPHVVVAVRLRPLNEAELWARPVGLRPSC